MSAFRRNAEALERTARQLGLFATKTRIGTSAVPTIPAPVQESAEAMAGRLADWRAAQRAEEEAIRARRAARIAATDPKPSRWFVRCADCLTVMAVDSIKCPPPAECACGGETEVMGRVEKYGRLQTGTRHETPCDPRCTNATGPKCDCPCGGENHGSGRVIEIAVTEGVPRVVTPLPAEAIRRAAEYKTALAAARVAVDAALPAGRAAYDRKARGAWVSNFNDYLEYQDARRRIGEAKKLRTHRGRLKALAAIVAKPRG